MEEHKSDPEKMKEHKSGMEKMKDAVKGAASSIIDKVMDLKRAIIGAKFKPAISPDEKEKAEDIKAAIDHDTDIAKQKVDKKAEILKARIDKESFLAKDEVDKVTAKISLAQLKGEEKIQDIMIAERIVTDQELHKIEEVKERAADMVTDVLNATNEAISSAEDSEKDALKMTDEKMEKIVDSIHVDKEQLQDGQKETPAAAATVVVVTDANIPDAKKLEGEESLKAADQLS